MDQHDLPSGARITLFASMVGTTIEFYDYYIYATAAGLILGPLFFPSSSRSAQLLAAFLSLSLAFVARPVGAVFFGHYGDRIGRKSTLVAALSLMGVATSLIALLPTFGAIGWLAPLALCVLRFVQGFGLGGEWSGAALLAVENAPPGWSGRYGLVPQLGAPIGYILANASFLLLSVALTPQQFLHWGWRLPFVAGAPLILIGLYVRLQLTEPAAFLRAARETASDRLPIASLLRYHWRVLSMAAVSVIAGFAAFYIGGPFALGYGTTVLGYSRNAFLLLQLGAVIFFPIGIILSGMLSDGFGAGTVLTASCLCIALAGEAMLPLLGGGTPARVFLFLAIVFGGSGLAYGPLAAYLSDVFPPRLRYSGTAVAFNLGGVVGGGFTPMIAQALAGRGGLGEVGHYLSGLALLSLLGTAASWAHSLGGAHFRSVG